MGDNIEVLIFSVLLFLYNAVFKVDFAELVCL